jgi:hypothetical protein
VKFVLQVLFYKSSSPFLDRFKRNTDSPSGILLYSIRLLSATQQSALSVTKKFSAVSILLQDSTTLEGEIIKNL